jgi:hypothetical protein
MEKSFLSSILNIDSPSISKQTLKYTTTTIYYTKNILAFQILIYRKTLDNNKNIILIYKNIIAINKKT